MAQDLDAPPPKPDMPVPVSDSEFAPGTAVLAETVLCPCGRTLRRLSRIYGRNDNMVKVRGVNVFSEALGETCGTPRQDAAAAPNTASSFDTSG